MDEKKYHINYVPSSARDIIREARWLDQEFNNSFIQSTSSACSILRRNGYVVGEVEEIEK